MWQAGWRGGILANWADVGEQRQRIGGGLRSAAASRGSCGEGDCVRGQEASVTGVGRRLGAARRRRAGGVVETVTSAKPTRGQLLAHGKGKRQRKDCGGKRIRISCGLQGRA